MTENQIHSALRAVELHTKTLERIEESSSHAEAAAAAAAIIEEQEEEEEDPTYATISKPKKSTYNPSQ